MNTEKIKRDTCIRAIKDTLNQKIFKWRDTGENVSYDGILLNIHGLKEPLSYNQAHKIYSTLSNDPRIVSSLIQN